MELDRRVLLDAGDEVARHRVGEPVAAHEYVDARGRLCQEHGCLARRISAADDHDLLAPAELRFHEGRGVVDAGAFELREVRDRGLAVLGAGRDDDRAGLYALAIPGLDHIGPAARVIRCAPLATMTCAPNFWAWAKPRPVSAWPVMPVGKPEEVLDLRARAGLAAGHVGFDHEHVEALRGAKHGGREPGGAGADDQDVADVASRRWTR